MEQEKKIHRARRIFTILCIIFAAGTSIYLSTITYNAGGIALETGPLLLAGAFCGNLPGLIAVILVFQFRAVVDSTSSYVIALYLIAVMLAARGAKRRTYRSLFRTILLGLALAAIIGALNGLVVLFVVAGEVSADLGWNMISSYAYAIPESMGALLITYLLFRFLPSKIKIYIPNGIYYIDEDDPVYGGMARRAMSSMREEVSRLSFRIRLIIIIEAVILTLSAAAFAIHLVSILNPTELTIEANKFLNTATEEMASTVGAMSGAQQTTAGGNEARPAPPERRTVSEGEAPPEKPSGEPEDAPEPRAVGIFGRKLEDSVSKNGIFNDDAGFNPMDDRGNLDSRTAIAFAFRLCMILFTIGVVTAAIANAYIQASVARPIRMMSKTMKGFAFSDKDGKIGGAEKLSSLNIHSRDEIEELYHALEKTVLDTEEYLERLREEDRMKNELEVAKASSNAKSAFLSSMSHEIRTPINAVLGFDEMILMENKDPEIGKYAEDIQSAGKTLLALINDILDFSKIEAGKMDIVPAQYELTSTINDVVSMTMSLANDKGLTFDVTVDPKTPHMLYGDEIRIKQCMTNILSNAVKYTEKGGLALDIGFDRAADEGSILLNVSVKDTGIGIRKEDMDKLFSAFDRLDQVRNKAVKGTGLGMSITKQLLENMGSELKVESEYEKGSNFHFSVRQGVTKWEEIGDLSEAFKKYIPHDGAEHRNDTFYAPDAHILVTDDTENNLLVVTRLLKRTGIQIDTADSGEKTLELAAQNKYDIIYLDHMMPEMDGIETLHRMKELPGNKNPDTPVIVLTANAVSGSREMYMKEGFTDYMTKPVSYLSLKESLLKYLPGDKVGERLADEGSDSEPAGAGNIVSEALSKVQGIDIKEGITYSGDEDTLIDVIKGFSARIEDAAADIEKELHELSIKNYTVHVHALKSSARLIGAKELSELALEMENTGNAYQKAIEAGDVDSAGEALSQMEDKTPELLSLYRSYKEKLAPVASAGESEPSAEGDLPEISPEELSEMLMGIHEFAEAFDMDSVDQTMQMIEGYRIPDDKKELIGALKKAVRNVDRDGILDITKADGLA